MNESRRILVIEDDPILRELVADWLLAAGYRVGVAAQGQAGIEQATSDPPALVVTDINMPGISGAAVIAELTRRDPSIPVIAISAHFRSEHGLTPEEAMGLGAARALAKPFKRGDILRAVIELVGPPEG